MASADVHRGKHANPYPEEEDDEENDEEDDLAALEEQLEPPVQLDTSYKTVIVVDNTPVVGPEKYDKLVTVLKKIFSALGTLREEGFLLPQDPKTNNTVGYCFVEFARPEDAERAMEQAQDYRLDKSHSFKLTRYEDFERFLTIPDVYQAPEVKTQQEREFLHNWLLDPLSALGHEQYVIRYGDETELYWNNDTGAPKPDPVYHRKHMTETYVKWSPHGTYLATFHVQGIVLWGGPTQISGKTEFSRVVRLAHPGVKLIDFSPCERYMASISSQFQTNDNPKDPQGIIIWDLRSGKKLRGFLTNNSTAWPAFVWSHDGKYLARLGQDIISVYETPGMDLLEKKSIKAPGAKDLSWSPADHLLGYWVAETGNTPARVVLLDIPSRRERRTQNLFNVADCRLHWQSKGDYLAVKVDRTTKSKKTSFTSFEFFRLREKDIPVESLELKDIVGAVEWEPTGTRIAITVGESARPDVHFYELKAKKIQQLKVLEKKTVNTLVWSPRGTFIVLAGLKNLNGALEFYNVTELESLTTDEHFMATHVEWEPTGRQVATYVSAWSHQFENGYNLWTFQGKLARRVVKEKFYSLSWRPRPPSKLTAEQEAQVVANLDKYIDSQESSDKARGRDADAAAKAKRDAERSEWEAFAAAARAHYKAEKEKRKALRRGFDSDDESQYVVVEKIVEELVDVTEEPAGK